MSATRNPRARNLNVSLLPLDKDDQPLATLISEEMPVSIFLVNGVKLQGTIAWASETLVILRGDRDQVIVRSNIATVLPEGGVFFV